MFSSYCISIMIKYIKFSWINRMEGSLPVIHFFILLMSESNKFKDLSTDRTSLEWSFSKHKHHKLMLFIIIFILETSTSYITEGSISSENDSRVIDSSEVDCLDVIKVIVDLQVVRIVGVKSLPLMSDFIESIRCDVWGDGFIASIRTDSGFDVFKRSLQLRNNSKKVSVPQL